MSVKSPVTSHPGPTGLMKCFSPVRPVRVPWLPSKADAFPIDEFAGGRGGDAHRVVVVDHPGASLGDAAGSVVEPDRETLLGDVALGDLERPEERVAQLHAPIGGREVSAFSASARARPRGREARGTSLSWVGL